jgi:hypothetical protein
MLRFFLFLSLGLSVLSRCTSVGQSISWSADTSDITGIEDFSKFKIGDTYTITLSPGGRETAIWGTDVYSADSCIGTVAVHQGLITFEEGGTVTIEILPGQRRYTGMESNGVRSNDWDEYILSYRFVK